MEYGMPYFYTKIVDMSTCKVYRAKTMQIERSNIFKPATYSILCLYRIHIR